MDLERKNDMKSLEYALQTELDGIDFYLKQADDNKENALHKIFIMLVKDENRHAEIIRKMMQGAIDTLPDNEALATVGSIFDGAEVLSEGMYSSSEQLAVYRLAREIESKGIDLYLQLFSDARSDSDKAVFKYLMEQERQHYDLFDELAKRVGRPEEWVESAEFGAREEY